MNTHETVCYHRRHCSSVFNVLEKWIDSIECEYYWGFLYGELDLVIPKKSNSELVVLTLVLVLGFCP